MNVQRPQRLRAFIWVGAAVFCSAVLTVALLLAVNAREAALAQSATRAMRFVDGAEATLNRTLLAVDVMLSSLADREALPRTASDSPDWTLVRRRLQTAARLNLTVRYVALLDAQGHVLASSDSPERDAQFELPADFLHSVLEPPVSTLMISAPVVSFVSAEKVLYVARHLRIGPQPSQQVVAVTELPLSQLSAVLMQGTDITGLQVTLERVGGQLLLSLPARDDSVAPVLQPRLDEMLDAGQNWQAPARLTGEPALVVARPILFHDLRIAASVPLEAALLGWRGERNAITAAALGFMSLILVAAVLTLRSINRLTAARAAIVASKNTLDQALESMVSGFVLLDSQFRLVQWNRRFEEMFPWLASTLRPMLPFRKVLEAKARYYLPEGTDADIQRWVQQRMALQLQPQGPHEQVQPDGRVIQITERPTPDHGLVITYHDVTELRRASAEIENLAFYDPLTNLPNRRLLMDRIQQACATSARSGQFGALLFLDLDHFKTLNDTLGHEVGDLLLRQVAQRLKACVRREDTVARLGGDEFVVMLQELSHNSEVAAAYARRVGEKILRKLNVPYTLGPHTHHSTPSIGATLMGGNLSVDVDWLKQADIAMYQVKSQGRNGLCFFDPQMEVAISQRAQLENDLQIALTSQQFVLHYQPQWHLDGRMVGAEALVRWQHPQRGLVGPGSFITVAEDSELIVPLGHWILRTACEQLARWQEGPDTRHLQLSVNVSARQFRQRDFVARVVEVLRETGVRPHLLKLELTESLVLDNVDDTIAKMELLKTKGVRFSVDDFGTGYSSLAYLTRLPLDQLKIDQSFIHNIGVKHTDDVIVQTIIGMAQNLQLDVLAEGVETQVQKDFLALHGCHFYQGYLFARPMPAAQLEAMLQAGSAAPAG